MSRQSLQVAGALRHPSVDKRIEILRRVGAGGSISQAARDAGVSYKAAWQALDTLSNLAGTPLVDRVVGGAGGGGARLTSAGEQLLRAAQEVERARELVLERIAAVGALPANVAGLALRTSMRNQMPCRVLSLRALAGAMEVRLELPAAAMLRSRITRESAQLLQLCAGHDVLALCKATAVEVRTSPAPHGVNLLQGIASRVPRAGRAGEASLSLAGGLQIVGFVGEGTGLKRGSPAFACIDPSAVVIALAA